MLERLPGMGELRVGRRILVRENPAHAAHHVVQDVAVEKPVAPRLLRGIELNHLRGHGLDIHRELQRGKISVPVDQAEKMPVQVHGVPHHRIIGQDDADILAFPDHNPVRFRQRPAVDAPDIAVHISAQLKMQFLHGNAGGEVRFCEGP